MEPKLLETVKACVVQLLEASIAQTDANIVASKAERREAGYAVERRGDERRMQTQLGELCYKRTYFKKASGGYEYLVDTALGIESRARLSEGLSLQLVQAAKDMSYEKSSTHIAKGDITRQTVMNHVRRSKAVTRLPEKRRVAELHVDADEAHVTLCGGRKSEVPLVSVYEGIERNGKRNRCKNVFHISKYGMKTDDFWEHVLTEIERRYDIADTKIYLHGDGANWIQAGLEWLPNAVFVLDKYHKNKAIKAMTAGFSQADRKVYDKAIRDALAEEDMRFFDEVTESLCTQQPEREDKIIANARYLARFVKGISVCVSDPRANDGGCTEPHVSHVLAARLSSRPMAWSKETLTALAPILASGNLALRKRECVGEPPVLLRNAVASASRAFRRRTGCCPLGLPAPDAIGRLPVTGKVTGLQKILKAFA